MLDPFAWSFPTLARFFFRPFRGPLPGYVFWVILASPWSPFDDILVLLGSILTILPTTLVPFGSLLVFFTCRRLPKWAPEVPEDQINQKTPPNKTKSIEQKKNTQACKQTKAEPPGRVKWVGGTPEGITIYGSFWDHFEIIFGICMRFGFSEAW